MKYVIGLDIGGTKINGIVFDGKKVLKELTIVTPKNLPEFKISSLKIVDFLSADYKINAVGIGIAGQVDLAKGLVDHSPNIPFINKFKIAEFIFKERGFATEADNDANCFTRAELVLGQGKQFKNFLGLTLGTGIGGGIVIEHKIYRGQNNSGAELGHMLSNGKYIESIFQNARDARSNSQLGLLLGDMFASLANAFAPDALILGGGVSTDKTRNFLPLADKQMRKLLFNKELKIKILVSKLKNPGALGSALLVC